MMADPAATTEITNGIPIEKWTAEEKKRESRRIYKNIFLISFAFLMLFTSYSGLSRLQSSLHRVDGMGTISQSVLYGAMVISCLFVPKPMIAAIGHKWTVAIAMSGYTLWMAANGYAVWGTMIPTSILVGISAAPLWTAQCAYFTKLGVRYAELNGEQEKDVISRFFGIFFMLFQLSGAIGSVISFTVLRTDDRGNRTLTPEELADHCGVNDCPGSEFSNPNLEKPPESTVWTMVGIYLVVAFGAILLVALLVENLPKEMRDPKFTRKELLSEATATVKHLRNKEQLLLIPLTMYSGFEQTFFSADYPASFITCTIGIYYIGLVTIAYSLSDTGASVGSGFIVKYVGRVPIFVVGLVVDLSIQTTLQIWVFQPGDEYVLYIIAVLWGVTDGIWQTQINAMYGTIFSKNSEAAFSNYRMWESFGFIIGWAYSSFLCTRVKLIILSCVLVVGWFGYGLTEVTVRRKAKEHPPFELEKETGTHPSEIPAIDKSSDIMCQNEQDNPTFNTFL